MVRRISPLSLIIGVVLGLAVAMFFPLARPGEALVLPQPPAEHSYKFVDVGSANNSQQADTILNAAARGGWQVVATMASQVIMEK